MPYVYIVVAVVVLFFVLHKLTELPMPSKVGVSIGALVLVIAFYLYEQSNHKATQTKHELLFAFNHGKDLLCGDKVVNNTLYNYASRSFIGKKDTKVYKSANIAIKGCVVKP